MKMADSDLLFCEANTATSKALVPLISPIEVVPSPMTTPQGLTGLLPHVLPVFTILKAELDELLMKKF